MSEDGSGRQNKLAHFCYLALTTVQVAVGLRFLYIRRDPQPTWNEWAEWVDLWAELSYVAITSTVVSVCITELGGYIVVLAGELKRAFDRRAAERDERARQEGRRELARRLASMTPEEREAELNRLIKDNGDPEAE